MEEHKPHEEIESKESHNHNNKKVKGESHEHEAHKHSQQVHHEAHQEHIHKVHHQEHTNNKPDEKSFWELLDKRNDLKCVLGGIGLFVIGVILMMIFPKVANPQTGGMLVSLGIPAMLIGVGFFVYGIILSVINLVKKNKIN